MHYYKRHIGDYIKDTSHLTLLEHGIYARLLDVYYTLEGPIPDDQVARLIGARTESEIATMRIVLGEFFTLIDSPVKAWRQGRCDTELIKYSEKSGKAKESAKARWEASERNTNAMRTHSEGNADVMLTINQEPITNKKQKEVSRASRKTPLPDGFAVSDRVKAWAKEKGFDRLQEHLEAFKAKALANGYKYSDWDSAFMEAIRGNWAKLPIAQPKKPAYNVLEIPSYQ